MFDWIKSLFGKGKIRFYFEGIDRNGVIRTGYISQKYIGNINTLDVDVAIESVKTEIYHIYDITVTKIEFKGIIQE